jgi:uncharacterized protein
MHIQRETPDNNTIRSYTEKEIVIGEIRYETSTIVAKDSVVSWAIYSIEEVDEEHLKPILELQPEIIIIGHHQRSQLPMRVMQYLSRQRIGVECMSVGAACRTFNVLLAEGRVVVLGVIF